MQWLSLLLLSSFLYALADAKDNDVQKSTQDVVVRGDKDSAEKKDAESSDDTDADDESDQEDEESNGNESEDSDVSDSDDAEEQVPPKSKEESPDDVSVDEDEEVGIDTVNLQDPAGNWLYKRKWWEKAEESYDKIKEAVSDVLDSRMYFFEQGLNLDRRIFDPFYQSLGLTKGELQEAVNLLTEQLQYSLAQTDHKKRERKAIITELQEEKEKIEKLRQQVDSIKNINHTVDDALRQLMNQVNQCREYEKEAWNHLRLIAKEVSDKVARDHFYAMKTVWGNVKKIEKYIKDDFYEYFNSLIADSKKRTDSITQLVNQLKEKGIDLKEKVKKAREPEPVKDDKAAEKDDSADTDDDADEVEPVGWIQWVMDLLMWPFKKVADLWHMIFG